MTVLQRLTEGIQGGVTEYHECDGCGCPVRDETDWDLATADHEEGCHMEAFAVALMLLDFAQGKGSAEWRAKVRGWLDTEATR